MQINLDENHWRAAVFAIEIEAMFDEGKDFSQIGTALGISPKSAKEVLSERFRIKQRILDESTVP